MEIEGRSAPITACTEPVSDGMVVHLNTPKVKRLRNTAFELLLSHHNLDCVNCAKNKNCGLQKTAAHLGLKLKPKRLRRIPRNLPVDSSHTLFTYDPNKCIYAANAFGFVNSKVQAYWTSPYRGIDTVVSTFSGIPLAEAGCTSCLACVNVCPVGSLVVKSGVGPIFIPRAGI